MILGKLSTASINTPELLCSGESDKLKVGRLTCSNHTGSIVTIKFLLRGVGDATPTHGYGPIVRLGPGDCSTGLDLTLDVNEHVYAHSDTVGVFFDYIGVIARSE